jgi:amino acid transporter
VAIPGRRVASPGRSLSDMTEAQTARTKQPARTDQAAAPALATGVSLPERLGYRVKRVILGPPLVTAQMHEEKLSKKIALGVLSSDCISSSAYGSEEMLIVLLAVFGLAGFHVLLPMTAVILVVLTLMTLSYRELVMVYTRVGGSYVVCRENFGYKTAQVASVALLIDYIVTVAIQTAAGTAAITSAVPVAKPWALEITIAVICLLAFGNLRGVREAGKTFAIPTYLFFSSVTAVILIGVIREILGELPQYALDRPNLLPIENHGHGILSSMGFFFLLKAFANGGASLTGLEAISDGVSAFKDPRGPNARRTLGIMALMLGFLVSGVSFLALHTHAAPFEGGSPTVISQVAKAVLGSSWLGVIGFILVQLATALILIAGANTPFTGFPFLASFVAEDSFLPRQLMRRGHRLAFSNGIIVLTLMSTALLVAVGPHVDKLVPFYSIGVFTGFMLAGFGMAKYHTIHKHHNWKRSFAINFAGGALSAMILVITVVVKFTEGAWLVVAAFPILWLGLMRLNRQYRDEARSLDLVTAAGKTGTAAPNYARHVVLVLVDRLDLAVIRALRYAGSLRPTDLRAVHVMLDSEAADGLQRDWIERGLGDRVPLEIVECPDRRLVRAIGQTALGAVLGERAEVTILLPRRTFKRLSGRILHDRTADRIAEYVGRLPHVSATIVPFDTTLDALQEQELEQRRKAAVGGGSALEPARVPGDREDHPPLQARDETSDFVAAEAGADGVMPISSVKWKQRVTIEGRIKIVQVGTTAGKSLEAQVFDETGGMRLLFFGRTRIPGIEPGSTVRVSGTVGEYKGHLALANPRYELLLPSEAKGH